MYHQWLCYNCLITEAFEGRWGNGDSRYCQQRSKKDHKYRQPFPRIFLPFLSLQKPRNNGRYLNNPPNTPMDTVLPSSLSQLPTTSMNRKENKDLEETEENRRIQDCLYTYHRSDKKKKIWKEMDCIFSFFFFNWSMVDLQCYVSFMCTAKWFSYTYTYTHIYSFFRLFSLVGYYKILTLVDCTIQ